MSASAPEPSVTAPEREVRPLDDVLLAMDVVDTLRHRERLVARELDAAGREAELIARLKEIYAAQGIEVPEHILRDGVKALEERRFVYEPPEPGIMVRLARIYVSRDRWVKPLVAIVAALGIGWAAWQFGYVQPKERREAALVIELTETLPAEARRIRNLIADVSDEAAAVEKADALLASALLAAQQQEPKAARESLEALLMLRADLMTSYSVRVVYGPGEPYSGVFRIPEDVENARNFYLIVEAVDASGNLVEVPIDSEEDRRSARVTRWGQRVSEETFQRVGADKSDDQIIQNDILGRKPAGRITPIWDIDTPGGAILEW